MRASENILSSFFEKNSFIDDYGDKFEDWDENCINLRTKEIAKLAYQDIWLIPTI